MADTQVDLTATANTTVTPLFTFSGTCNYSIDGTPTGTLTSGVEGAIALNNGEVISYIFSYWESITVFDIRADKVSGDISGWTLPSSLVTFYAYNTSVSGDISGWTLPSSLVTFYAYSTSVSGDISGWTLPSSLVTFYAFSTSVSGDISGWTLPSSLVYFSVSSTSVSGDISGWTLPSSLVTLYAYSTSVSYHSGHALSGVTGAITKIDLDDCGLDWRGVDNVLKDCVASGVSGKVLEVSGSNAAPTSIGLKDRDTLVAGGWTVSVTSGQSYPTGVASKMPIGIFWGW